MNEASHSAVEELVAHYEAKARAVSRTGVVIGAFAGVLVGSIPLSPIRAAWPIPSSYGFATLLGGLVVGVLISLVTGYLGAAVAPLGVLALLVAVLLVRPSGLFASVEARRV